MNISINTLPSQRIRRIYTDKGTKFFLVKSFSDKNVNISQVYNIWATTPKNENKFVEAFMNNPYVVLIFSVNGSSKFCGYALMESRPGESKNKNVYFYYDQKIFRGKNFDIQWIRIVDVPFSDVHSITNRFNENKSVKVGRDGQEIERSAGVKLCELFETYLEKQKKQNMGIESPMGPTSNIINYNVGTSNTNLNKTANKPTTVPTATTNAVVAHNPFINNLNGSNQMSMIHGVNLSEMCHTCTKFLTNDISRCSDMVNIYGANNGCMNMDWTNFGNLYRDSHCTYYNMYNPALGIFPVDVSNMSYDDYISYYEKSLAMWQIKMLQN